MHYTFETDRLIIRNDPAGSNVYSKESYVLQSTPAGSDQEKQPPPNNK